MPPAPRRSAGPARPHRLRSVRHASAGRGGAGRDCPGAPPGGLGVPNARDTPCPKPAGACPATRFTAGPAQPHRLRSKRDASRRPGAAGGCGAAVLGRRVRGRPVPKGMQELNQLHKCPGLRRNPWRWYEPCWTDGRPARRPRGVKGARSSSRRGPPRRASHTGARTARRGPQATESCARKRVVGAWG